jgi:hypothetical protein
LRTAVAGLFTLLAVASLVAGLTLVSWAWVSPGEGPFWSAGDPGSEDVIRVLALIFFGVPAAAAALAFGAAAHRLRRGVRGGRDANGEGLGDAHREHPPPD